MSRRVHIANGRAVISLPGYDAPSPPLEGLSFDSSWPFAGLVIGRGVYSDPAPPHPDSAAASYVTESISTRTLAIQNGRGGYSHLLAVFLEMNGSRVVRQQIWRGSLVNTVTLSVPRKYIEVPGNQGSIRARGWSRFSSLVAYLVIAG